MYTIILFNIGFVVESVLHGISLFANVVNFYFSVSEANEKKIVEKSKEIFLSLENQRRSYKTLNRQNRFHYFQNKKYQNLREKLPSIFSLKPHSYLKELKTHIKSFNSEELLLVVNINEAEKNKCDWSLAVIKEVANLSIQIDQATTHTVKQSLAFHQACLLSAFASLNHDNPELLNLIKHEKEVLAISGANDSESNLDILKLHELEVKFRQLEDEAKAQYNLLILHKASILLLLFSLGIDVGISFAKEITIEKLLQDDRLADQIDHSFDTIERKIDINHWNQIIANTDDEKRVWIAKGFRSISKAIRQRNLSDKKMPAPHSSFNKRLVVFIQHPERPEGMSGSPVLNSQYQVVAVHTHFRSYHTFLQLADHTLTSIVPNKAKDLDDQYRELSKLRYKEAKQIKESELPKADLPFDSHFKISQVNPCGKKEKTQEIYDSEISFLDKDSIQVFEYFYNYLLYKCGLSTKVPEQNPVFEKLIKLHNYSRGVNSIDDLGINNENGREYLRLVKLFDWAVISTAHQGSLLNYTNSTYKLRYKVLQVSPQVKFPEALMRTLSPAKVADPEEMVRSKNWVSEEAANMGRMFVNQVVLARSLHHRIKMKFPNGLAIGLRGNTASGKSSFIKDLLRILLDEPEITQAMEKGVVNIDHLKACLKERGKYLNSQVHPEIAQLLPAFIKTLMEMRSTMILDSRLLTTEKAKAFIEPACRNQFPVWLIDFDVSLKITVLRLLLRSRSHDAPLPDLNAVIEGYVLARKDRCAVRACLINEKVSSVYILLRDNKTLGIVKQGQCDIKNSTKWMKVNQIPSRASVENSLNQIIFDSMIEKAIKKHQIPESESDLLRKWRGISLRDAYFHHLAEIEPNIIGRLKVSQFTRNPLTTMDEHPNLLEYIAAEQSLHMRGMDDEWESWHWENNKFSSNLNPIYNPENFVYMPVGYFKIPIAAVEEIKARNLDERIYKEVEIAEEYRFFVHPTSYEYYARLFEGKFAYISPDQSEFVGTPTSSYRTWWLRRVEKNGGPLFMVKFGVMGAHNDLTRMVTADDVRKSLEIQMKMQKASKANGFHYFPETLGLVVKNVGKYSGLIIREFPRSFLRNHYKIISFASLTSMERTRTENRGICSLKKGMEDLPLIVEVISLAIEKGAVKNTVEFIRKFLIRDYVDAIEEIHMKKGMSFSPHGQNLGLLINEKTRLPEGFILKDFEGFFEPQEKYLETHSWFYRYHVFIKLLNVLLDDPTEDFYLPSAYEPTQKGELPFQMERALYRHLKTDAKLGITKTEYLSLLKELDDVYITRLRRYFNLEKSIAFNAWLAECHGIPSAEPDSIGSERLRNWNKDLWSTRRNLRDDLAHLRDVTPQTYPAEVITYSEGISLLREIVGNGTDH